MTHQVWTVLIVVSATFVGLMIYDLYLMVVGGLQNTLSYHLMVASYNFPFLVFMAGFVLGTLVGHIFWGQR